MGMRLQSVVRTPAYSSLIALNANRRSRPDVFIPDWMCGCVVLLWLYRVGARIYRTYAKLNISQTLHY